MDEIRKTTLEMRTLLLCADAQFLGITREVVNHLQVSPKFVGTCSAALKIIEIQEFDVIVVDWRELDNLSEFLCAVRRSKINRHCVLVAIVRDMLDLKQSLPDPWPASATQFERCLRAAYCARVAQPRRLHREPVSIAATVSTRNCPVAQVRMVNISEGGAGLQLENGERAPTGAGEDLELRFALPGTSDLLVVSGVLVWVSAKGYGVRFKYIPDEQRSLLQWLTECVERSLSKLCERIRVACT